MSDTGFVYFIESGFGGNIKIGYATDPHARLRTLQTGNPDELHILALVKAPSFFEKTLHHEFRDEQVTGEWFAPSARLWAYLEKHWCYDETHGRREHTVVDGYVETKVTG